MKKETAAQIVGTADFRMVGQSDHPITEDEHNMAVEVGFEIAKKHEIDLAAHIAAQHEHEKRGPGAPKKMTSGKRVNVYLDDESQEIAAALGGENKNVSEGIRKALRITYFGVNNS